MAIRSKRRNGKSPTHQGVVGAVERPTVRDVAREAGVSLTTVSNVLNGKFSLMKADTRETVEQAIKRLGYRVNVTGRSLRSAKRTTVAFISLDDDVFFLRNLFNAAVVAGFTNAVSEAGFDPIINRIDPSRIEQHSLFSTDDVLGIFMILLGSVRENHRAMQRFATLQLPIVSLENDPPKDLKDFFVIRQDDFGGGAMLANHLRKQGVRKVLLIRHEIDWSSIESRDAGISSVFEELPGLALQRITIDHNRISSDVYQKLDEYLKENPLPEAIMGANDQIAAACVNFLRSRNLQVPQQVKVTGYNDLDPFDILPYKITTIRSQPYEMGFRGGQELVYRLRNGMFREPELSLSVSFRAGDTA